MLKSVATPPSSSASSLTGPARPIRLVYCDDDGKYCLDPEAVATLQLVKEPIGVVSVCGRVRQGKSFILNQLLGKSSGFQVGSTHRPCTKGLWLWSMPLKGTAFDGTECNLLLLDSEGIDAYDQTIFSLAVLLSSMFIYNQMGGIDADALDRLSLVTQMTKHIRVRASGGETSASEIGQISPIFVWLLRDFYLDLAEDNRKITPRDYLEFALRPVQGSGRDIAAENEIRDSIRALFPDRECFTLVRPLNNENDLQRLDQISLQKLRPEFRSGLAALKKFVFERTRPKQVGGTMITGPLLVDITQSYLDALNHGAVPTISSSWQSVEEAGCHRAYDSATDVYTSTFEHSAAAPEEVTLGEAHEQAVQDSMAAFNAIAVGDGAARKKYEGFLQKFFKKAFEDYRREALMEADILIHSMETRLRAACNASDAKIGNVAKVLDALLSECEKTIQGPGKWQKVAVFLQQSFDGPVLGLIKRQIAKVESEKSSHALQCRIIEDKMALLMKWLEASEGEKSKYTKRCEDAINEKNKLTDERTNHTTDLQECTNKQTQLRENALEEEFSGTLAEIEDEIRAKTAKIEHADKCLTTLNLELKDAEAKIRSYDTEISYLKIEMKELTEKLKAENAEAQSYEREATVFQQEKNDLEQKYRSELKRFDEVQERCKTAEREAARATELADKARAEAVMADKARAES